MCRFLGKGEARGEMWDTTALGRSQENTESGILHFLEVRKELG